MTRPSIARAGEPCGMLAGLGCDDTCCLLFGHDGDVHHGVCVPRWFYGTCHPLHHEHHARQAEVAALARWCEEGRAARDGVGSPIVEACEGMEVDGRAWFKVGLVWHLRVGDGDAGDVWPWASDGAVWWRWLPVHAAPPGGEVADSREAAMLAVQRRHAAHCLATCDEARWR